MTGPIAFFDFDGTITRRDSFLEFIKYTKGNFAFYAGFLLHAPFLIAYKLQIISNQRAKEMILRYFFGKMSITEFDNLCREFATEKMPSLVRPKALREIKKIQEAGGKVVVVSASAEAWLRFWCIDAGVECIGTRLAVDNDCITGKIQGHNCHGQEKVRRIREAFSLSGYRDIYCYGDTPGDRPMLALGTIRFYKPFR